MATSSDDATKIAQALHTILAEGSKEKKKPKPKAKPKKQKVAVSDPRDLKKVLNDALRAQKKVESLTVKLEKTREQLQQAKAKNKAKGKGAPKRKD